MDWMNNLFVVLILTTMTGIMFYLVGIPFRMIWFKDDIRLMRFQMQVTQWAFLIPFVYFILYIRMRFRVPIMGNSSNINLFYQTPAMVRTCIILGRIWVCMFLILLSYKIYRRWCWVMKCRGNIPEEDAELLVLFQEICIQLGIEGKVELCRNDSVRMPCLTRCHGFIVVLPLERYTKEEAAVIFYHELCHYLNRDIYVKTVSCIVALLHVFNPVAHIVLSQLSLACERNCDEQACLKGAGSFSSNEYFKVIGQVLIKEGRRERYNLFTLADTWKEYDRRVQYMKRHRVKGSIRRRTAVLLSVCFVLGSSITSLAAGGKVTEEYKTVMDATEERKAEEAVPVSSTVAEEVTESSLSDEEVVEEFARIYDLDPEKVKIMGEEGIEVIGDTVVVDWRRIQPGETFMTSGFSQEVGDSVTVTTVGSPSDIKYQMGIKDPDQIMRYVEGSGDRSYTFAITIKGRYYFFATNMDSSRELNIKATVIR